MRSLLLTLILCLTAVHPIAAQVNYTSANAVPVHSTRTYDSRENLELNGAILPVSVTGTDNIWDFSSIPLPAGYERTVHYEPAANSEFHSAYPNANLVSWEVDPFGSEDYQFFNNSPFELRLLGGVFVGDSDPLYVTFCPDPFLVMDYPMGIGSGVQHVYNCEGAQNETDDWVIMATGTVLFDGGSIEDLVLWRSIFTGPGFADTSYFWTQHDNVLFPVVRYHPGVSFKVREPLFETILSVEENTATTNFEVFPNPAEDRITIRRSDPQVQVQALVLDAAGRIAADLGTIPSASADHPLDIGSLVPGSYYLELRPQDDSLPQRKPFIKL